MSVRTGRRGELITYLLLIAVNLLVLPNWFSPGRFALPMRLLFIGLSAVAIAYCAWKVSDILGVSPFSKRKRPSYTPYEPAEEDGDPSGGGASDADEDEDMFTRARRRREQARSYGQAQDFVEYDPYDEAPDEQEPPGPRPTGRDGEGPGR